MKNNKKEKLAVVQYRRVYCIEDSSDYNYIFGRSSGSDYKKNVANRTLIRPSYYYHHNYFTLLYSYLLLIPIY